MPLAPGARLGPYEILAAVGVGGMGEVYRARDTRLDRIVAVKMLPSHLAEEPEKRARFEREARAISGLSHPHICTLYDVGREGGVDYLVMEYLEGETLAHRLDRGPLPPEQLLRIAVAVADALEKAHRQGVVHRDLKPANIMLTKTGAKLLDFGLAKSTVRWSGTSGQTTAATESKPLTGEGTLVGTLQYMAPEQLEGKEADSRSDIFALGAVLYEMATGRKAFEGSSPASVIAAILESQPPALSTLQPLVPPALERVVKICLAKDPEERWETAHDLKLQLQWILEAGSQAGVPSLLAARRRHRTWLAWTIASVLLAALIVTGYFWYRQRAPAQVVRSFILPPEGSAFVTTAEVSGPVALSPDGRQMAFSARGPDEKILLWVRRLDSLTAKPIEGTDGGSYPFWSADSRNLGFFEGGKLKKVGAFGGPVQALCDAPDGRGGAWSEGGTILFTPGVVSPLYRVSAGGGQPVPVTTLDAARQENSHRWPDFLPDGRHFIYFGRSNAPENNGIYAASLDGGPARLLLRAESNGLYASPGYLLFVKEGVLLAQRFDANKLQLKGEPLPLAESVEVSLGTQRSSFSISENGLLAYHTGSTAQGVGQLAWFDRSGKPSGTAAEQINLAGLRVSPDGRRVAMSVVDLQTGIPDAWVYDLSRGVRTRLTFGKNASVSPIWSPDGARVAYVSIGQGIAERAADGSGSERTLLEVEANLKLGSWSPDGQSLAWAQQATQPKAKWEIWMLQVSGDRKPFPFLRGEFNASEPMFSPDGQWLAYASDESGREEVYVTAFPSKAGRLQISVGGGFAPRWALGGREIVYANSSGRLMNVEIRKGRKGELEAGIPEALPLPAPLIMNRVAFYDATANGKRFLLDLPSERPNTQPITLVANWPAALTH